MKAPEQELREALIDKLDNQRFGDNIVNRKLLYKDIEWIIDELLPVIAHYLRGLADGGLPKGLPVIVPLMKSADAYFLAKKEDRQAIHVAADRLEQE